MKHKKAGQDGKPRNPRQNHTRSAIKKSKHKDAKYKKFQGNTKEGQGFADKRKTKMFLEYKKTLRKDQGSLNEWSKKTQKIYKEESQRETDASSSLTSDPKQTSSLNRKTTGESRFKKAEEKWKLEKEKKEKQKQELQRIQKERDAALAKYHKSKSKKHKKLCVKNYKGQPNMASQMDLLLNKIQAAKGKR